MNERFFIRHSIHQKLNASHRSILIDMRAASIRIFIDDSELSGRGFDLVIHEWYFENVWRLNFTQEKKRNRQNSLL